MEVEDVVVVADKEELDAKLSWLDREEVVVIKPDSSEPGASSCWSSKAFCLNSKYFSLPSAGLMKVPEHKKCKTTAQ